MANGLGRFGSLAGGIARGLVSAEELELKQKAEERAGQAERRMGVNAALAYLDKVPDLAKLDPQISGPVFEAYLRGAEQLGLNVGELRGLKDVFATVPGVSKLYAKIASGRGTVEDEGQLQQLAPDALKSALSSRNELREVQLGREVAAQRKAIPGLEPAEVAAREAPTLGVSPERVRQIYGEQAAQVGARAGAEQFAKVQADWEADPERREAEIDLLRAQAEAARRDPTDKAKVAFQRTALIALRKFDTGQELSEAERPFLALAKQQPDGSINVDLWLDVASGKTTGDELTAVIAALASAAMGAQGITRPPRVPVGAAGQAGPPATQPGKSRLSGQKTSRPDGTYRSPAGEVFTVKDGVIQ